MALLNTLLEILPSPFYIVFKALLEHFYFVMKLKNIRRWGVDFSLYLYIPEIDPITKDVRHGRADHNHVYKRTATSSRNGNCPPLDYAGFDAVLCDSKSGLTHNL